MREARLFCGVNTEEKLFATDVMEEFWKSLPRLDATLCIWKPEPKCNGFSGTCRGASRGTS